MSEPPANPGRPWRLQLLRCLLLAAGLPGLCLGHDFTITDTSVAFGADGTFEVDMICDLDALLLGAGPEHPPEELVARIGALAPLERRQRVQRLESLFERRVRVRFDGQAVPFAVTFPDREERPHTLAEPPSYLGVTARFSGPMPPGAEQFTFWASRSFQTVHLSFIDEDGDVIRREVLGIAIESTPYPVAGGIAVDRRPVIVDFLALGFRHILPDGGDHILFVVGLFLLSTRLGSLLWQVTAFTVAHTLTLALSTYGVVTLPGSVVEPLIGLSIAYVAVENVVTTEVRTWRVAVVFAFGMLHGLGFAGALATIGLPRTEFLTALVGFNLGVELGQLAVIGLAFAMLGWARRKSWYRKWIVVPLSVVIAGVGILLVVGRVM